MTRTFHHPSHLARAIAEVLMKDQVAAAQVQQFIPPHHLIKLLDLKPYIAGRTFDPPAYETSLPTRLSGRPVIDEEGN